MREMNRAMKTNFKSICNLWRDLWRLWQVGPPASKTVGCTKQTAASRADAQKLRGWFVPSLRKLCWPLYGLCRHLWHLCPLTLWLQHNTSPGDFSSVRFHRTLCSQAPSRSHCDHSFTASSFSGSTGRVAHRASITWPIWDTSHIISQGSNHQNISAISVDIKTTQINTVDHGVITQMTKDIQRCHVFILTSMRLSLSALRWGPASHFSKAPADFKKLPRAWLEGAHHSGPSSLNHHRQWLGTRQSCSNAPD